ncbi:MAG: hypothetical protein K9K84_05510 [Methylovulum sp.]|jgi:hypothetical protein|nr:hypothetical protein [Methylovulum sp.]
MFSKFTAAKPHGLRVSLTSHLEVNLVDTFGVDLHPAFVRPEGLFFIKAIGENFVQDQLIDTCIYVENNGNFYVFVMTLAENKVTSVSLYQNILTLTPTEEEWAEVLRDIASPEFVMDDIVFTRTVGGASQQADLIKFTEHLQTESGVAEGENSLMVFARTLPTSTFVEKLRIVVEVSEQAQSAELGFYVGFEVDPALFTLLG